MRTRHRVIVAAFVIVGAGIAAATLLGGPQLVRLWKHRTGIRAVRTLEELEQQSEELVGDVPVKFGVDTRTPDTGAPVLLYATCRSVPAQVLIHVDGAYVGMLFSQGPYEIPGRALFVTSVPVQQGAHVIELKDTGGTILTSCPISPTERPFHCFMPLEDSQPASRRRLKPLPVVPWFVGGAGLLDGDTEEWPRVRGLPRIYPDDSPTIRLERHAPGFSITSPTAIFPSRYVASLLVRVWVNDKPIIPSVPTENVSTAGYSIPGSFVRETKLDFGLDLRAEPVHARPGDRIGLQCVWATPGFFLLGRPDATGPHERLSKGGGLSNRIDFTLP
jgi:hypothetical protein